MDQSNQDKLICGVCFIIESVALLIGAEELLGLLSQGGWYPIIVLGAISVHKFLLKEIPKASHDTFS